MSTKNKKPKIGHKTVRSQFEFNLYKEIKSKLPPGAKVFYEPDKIEYTLVKNYVPDFRIQLKDGTSFYIEAKGLGRAFDFNARQKMVAVKEQHPDKDVKIVFMSDGPLSKGSRTRPSDWANKYGYEFSIKSVPTEWFK
jgi:hypothetical protein